MSFSVPPGLLGHMGYAPLRTAATQGLMGGGTLSATSAPWAVQPPPLGFTAPPPPGSEPMAVMTSVVCKGLFYSMHTGTGGRC